MTNKPNFVRTAMLVTVAPVYLCEVNRLMNN